MRVTADRIAVGYLAVGVVVVGMMFATWLPFWLRVAVSWTGVLLAVVVVVLVIRAVLAQGSTAMRGQK